MCSLSNNTGSTSYSYDSHGRLTGKIQSAGATPLTVSHTYNGAGQRIGSLSPGGQSIEYQWTGNRITAIYSNGQPLITQITYEPDGQVNGWNWGNNQQNERFYDLSGRNIIVSMGFDAQTQRQGSRYYGYDAAGRQTSAIDDLDPSLNQSHDYDQLDRLTSSQRGEPQLSRTDYSYDLSGNRTEKITDNATLHSYSTDTNSNRLHSQSGAQTVNYSYDPAGNLTGDGTYSHSYNAAGRRIATTHTATAQTTGYGYDALGQRISKTHAGNTRQYFYDEQGHLTGEYDATGQPIQEIIWVGDLPVAVLKKATNPTATPDLYYIHADHLGTPRKITQPNDNRVVWTWESEAFGNSLPDQNPSGLGTFVFNLRFPGQYYDAETGLFYNYFRDYNPAKGRYIESDPIGLAAGINTYAYVGVNPVNAIDPWGLRVIFEGPRKAVAELKKEYEELKKTKSGKEFCEKLEASPEEYIITNKTNNFIQKGDRASYNDGFKTIVVDPNYHPKLNTVKGPQDASTTIVLGHEIGHAATGLDDGPSGERMENVNATENLIRDELDLPRRTTYP